jgi:hypothetical protein
MKADYILLALRYIVLLIGSEKIVEGYQQNKKTVEYQHRQRLPLFHYFRTHGRLILFVDT